MDKMHIYILVEKAQVRKRCLQNIQRKQRYKNVNEISSVNE